MRFIVFFTMLFSLTTISQKIEGTVFDKETNIPLHGVSVHLVKNNAGVATDNEGRFILRVHKNDVLVFTHIGYKSQEISVSEFKKNGLVVYLNIKVESLNPVNISSKSNLRYSLRYTKLAPLENGIYAFGSLLDNDNIYVVGGNQSYESDEALRALATDKYVNSNATLVDILYESRYNFNYQHYEDNLLIYNVGADTWEESDIKFRKRANNNLLKYDDKLIVLGGKRLSMNQEFEYLDDKIEVFDLSDNEIIIDNVNPHQAVDFASVIENDNLIVIGGSIKIKSNDTKVFSDKVHMLDLKTGLWFELANMPKPKETKGILVKDKIFLIGGYNNKVLKGIESLDLKTGKWKEEGELFDAIRRPALTYFNDVIYIFDEGKMMTLNVKTNQLDSYSVDLYLKSAELFYSNGTLYLLGGYKYDDFSITPSPNLYRINLDDFEKTRIKDSKKI
ncbi:MAG: galactose oxidase [Flavobacteriaceae bacterium]|nr:MAG: galactose oxidase [Flavobacteriaceae bacterium]